MGANGKTQCTTVPPHIGAPRRGEKLKKKFFFLTKFNFHVIYITLNLDSIKIEIKGKK